MTVTDKIIIINVAITLFSLYFFSKVPKIVLIIIALLVAAVGIAFEVGDCRGVISMK